jgi:hypothetical protein
LLVFGLFVGGLFFFLIASILVGYAWMTWNGDQLLGEAVVGERARAYFALHPERDDPGVNALLRRIEQKLGAVGQRGSSGGADELMQRLQSLSRQTSGFEQMFPREVWVGVEPGADGGPAEIGVAVNTRAFGNSLRAIAWFFERVTERDAAARGEDAPVRIIPHRTHSVVQLPDLAVALHGSTVLLSQNLDVVTRVLDRVDDAPKTAVLPERFGALRHALSKGSDAHVVIESPWEHFPGLFGSSVEQGDALFRPLTIVSATADLVTDDELRGVLTLTSREGAELETLRLALDAAAGEAVERATESGLVLTVDTTVDGQDVKATYRLTGIAAKVDSFIEASAEASN